MADRLERLIEMECADALLDSGVSVPLKRWKLPWLKRPVEVRVTTVSYTHLDVYKRQAPRKHLKPFIVCNDPPDSLFLEVGKFIFGIIRKKEFPELAERFFRESPGCRGSFRLVMNDPVSYTHLDVYKRQE